MTRMTESEIIDIVMLRFPHLLNTRSLETIILTLPYIDRNLTVCELQNIFHGEAETVQEYIIEHRTYSYTSEAEILAEIYPYWVDMEALLAREDMLTVEEMDPLFIPDNRRFRVDGTPVMSTFREGELAVNVKPVAAFNQHRREKGKSYSFSQTVMTAEILFDDGTMHLVHKLITE